MITEAWNEVLALRGTAPALWAEDGSVLRSFSDIEAEAREWEATMRERGCRGGEVLAIQIGNRAEGLALLLAAWRCALVVLPLGFHVGAAERELALETAGVSWLVEREGERAGGIRLVQLQRKEPAWRGWSGQRPDLLKLTSGTTSAPRLIRFRQETLLEDCRQICETMGFDERDVNYGVIPVSHSYGFSNLMTPLLARGVSMVLSEDRMPRAILNGLAATGATVFPGMPVFFDKLAALEGGPALPRLRLCISAGAPLTPEVGRGFTERFGLRVHTFYGSSECGGIAYDAREHGEYGEGFVGRAMSRVTIKALEGGRICVEGKTVGDGYWSALSEETQEGGFRQGGFCQGGFCQGAFSPEDLLREGPEGWVLEGRASDMINIAGRKLNPREVEARLMAFPGVREVVVFGVPSALRHEEAVAWVTGEVEAIALMRFARQQLSQWQVPKAIRVVGEIPRSERGKVNRRELAKAWLSMRE